MRWTGPILDSIEAEKRVAIDRALTATKGNRTHAAKLLGVHPRTIHNVLRRHPDLAAKHPAPKAFAWTVPEPTIGAEPGP